jgi:uncharacterized protein YkwD
MKKLIVIAFFAITFASHAQSVLDTLIFDKVNEYREENCLSPLKWSKPAHAVALNQAEYCSRVKYVYHDQVDSTVNDSTFQVEPTFARRFTKCGIGDDSTIHTIAENLLVLADTTNKQDESFEAIAERTLMGWKTSPSHNAMMLMKDLKFASIAHIISDSYVKNGFDFSEMVDYSIVVTGKSYYIALDAHD